ncbi:MAG: hypothetical protein Q7T76_01555 [Ferruginibacter sp.]|nr:hypothetical protein [Ferruginibacter sp.]
MSNKPTFWQRMGLHDWFLKNEHSEEAAVKNSLTPGIVYKYIVDKFEESIRHLSFAQRVVFYHEYIISFNAEDYAEFMHDKKGIFGLIIQESLKQFYDTLKGYRSQGKTVEPSSGKWVFRFASHPDYKPGDLGFIGKLLPGGNTNHVRQEENLRVTYIPRQTGIAQTLDINQDILKGFNFYSEGYYEIPYREDLVLDSGSMKEDPSRSFGRFETTVPDKEFAGKKLEFFMKDPEIIVSGKDETRTLSTIFRIPSEWVSTPHLRIRYEQKEDKFFVASFGEKTIVNEIEIKRSEPAQPKWTDLPLNSRIVLNGIVGINLFKS